MQPLDLLFLVMFLFYISRYHFSLIIRASYIWKKDFLHENTHTHKHTHTHTHKYTHHLLSVTKVFCWCSIRKSRENKLSLLENLQNCVTPLGNSKVEKQTHRNSTWVFLEHSWKLHFFFNLTFFNCTFFNIRGNSVPIPQLYNYLRISN